MAFIRFGLCFICFCFVTFSFFFILLNAKGGKTLHAPVHHFRWLKKSIELHCANRVSIIIILKQKSIRTPAIIGMMSNNCIVDIGHINFRRKLLRPPCACSKVASMNTRSHVYLNECHTSPFYPYNNPHELQLSGGGVGSSVTAEHYSSV